MNRAERKRLQQETVDALRHAVASAIAEGAVGFHIAWLLPGGEYGDAYRSGDVLAMTEAVSDSALKARIDHTRGDAT